VTNYHLTERNLSYMNKKARRLAALKAWATRKANALRKKHVNAGRKAWGLPAV
jgi:hypothetical protein